VHPDTLTILGLVFVIIASVMIANGQFTAAALMLIVGLPLDALDGAVARAMQRQDSFGAVLDSTLDRYADAFIFSGFGYYFVTQDRHELLALALAALVGAYSVSYIRARAEGVNLRVTLGWFSRLERLVLVLVMLIIPPLTGIGLAMLALGTNLTALQRLWFVYNALKPK
jgi:CDP-diacylglycerol--glycerol-3-phosphate 3-phosphatidyltransferase